MDKKIKEIYRLVDVELVALIVTTVIMQLTAVVLIGQVIQKLLK
jgi:hypothetical protein